MKKKSLLFAILLLFTLIPTFGVFNHSFYKSSAEQTNKTGRKENLKISYGSRGIISISSDSEFTSGNGVLKGGGSFNDPYIIANWTIDAGGSENCINITDTSAYFIIRNCTLLNAVSSGIKLGNNGNATIHNNTIFNNQYGIYLQESNNNTISGNNCSSNAQGILFNADNNTISQNYCAFNTFYGIRFSKAKNNTISHNNCTNNDYHGIEVGDSTQNTHNNTISDNLCTLNGKTGIFIYGEKTMNNTFSKNNCSSNTESGVYVNMENPTDNNNTFLQNECSLNDEYGFYLKKSNDNSLIGNDFISNKVDGLLLNFSNNNQVLGNNCSLNEVHGMSLWESANNTISDNDCINNTESGINLQNSNTHNLISDNDCYENLNNGIAILFSNTNNTFSDNDCVSNKGFGILLDQSHNNTINGNYYSLNEFNGIRLSKSSNNTIWKNILYKNNGSEAYCVESNWNKWDYKGKGNYWQDYKTSYPSATNDGYVWSIPYKIKGTTNTHDNYPLVTQDGSFLDEILPGWVQTPSDQTMYNNQSFVYDINASDNVEIDAYWLNASSTFQIAKNGTITNTSILSVTDYIIKVFVNDTSDNTISKTFNLQVQEATTSDGGLGDDDGDQDDGDDDTGDGGQDGLSIRGPNLGIIIGIVSIAIIGIAKSSKLKKFYSE